MRVQLRGEDPLHRVSFDVTDDGRHRTLLDLARLEFATPLELTATVAWAEAIHSAGGAATLRMPTNTEANTYMERMDVVALAEGHGATVAGSATAGPRRRRTDLVEVRCLRDADDADRFGEDLLNLIDGHADPTAAARAVVMAGELVDNALSHSGSSAGCFVAAQRYKGEKTFAPRIEFAVSDAGVGVLHHLRRNPAVKARTSKAAITAALTAGVSGETGTAKTAANRGYGLGQVLTNGARYGGRFLIRSGNGLAVATLGLSIRTASFTSPCRTPGTWAWFRMFIPR